MPRRQSDSWDDEDDRWQADPDDEPADDDSDEDGAPTVECPHCHRQILEDSPYCPYCENYLSSEDAPPHRRPWWFIIGFLLCMLVMYAWIMGL